MLKYSFGLAGVLALNSLAWGGFSAPTGIYVLGNAQDNPATVEDERLKNIRNYDFVSGYTLRVLWSDIEKVQGVYDFSVIDKAVAQVGAIGKRVNLEVLDSQPQYVINGAGATYIDHRNTLRTVPWDGFAQSRYAALQTALAEHVVNDGSGLKLSEHPVLAAVDASSTGLNYGVRDLNNGIRSHPQYTQQKYIDSVLQGVAASRSAFPNHQGYLAFFAFTDGTPGVPVDQQLITQLSALYNGTGQNNLAFFIENLSDIGPIPTGGSGGTGNNLLQWNILGGQTMAQALDSWLAHRPDRDPQLASLNPVTGMELMYTQYGTRFFELYIADIDGAVTGAVDAAGVPLIEGMNYWSGVLTAIPEPTVGLIVPGAAMLLGRRRT